MAKQEKPDGMVETKKEVYQLKDSIKEVGYSGTIDGDLFVISKRKYEFDDDPKTGKKKFFVTREAIIHKNGKPVDELMELSEEQIHQLLIAKVIELTPEQITKYKEYLNKKYAGK